MEDGCTLQPNSTAPKRKILGWGRKRYRGLKERTTLTSRDTVLQTLLPGKLLSRNEYDYESFNNGYDFQILSDGNGGGSDFSDHIRMEWNPVDKHLL